MEYDTMRVLQLILDPKSIPVVAIICFSIVGIIATLSGNWRKARQKEAEAALKSELVKQGRSVEDIERIIKANSKAKEVDE